MSHVSHMSHITSSQCGFSLSLSGSDVSIMVHALLDNLELLTDRQREVVELYYRHNLQQTEIAEQLTITQQAVADSLQRARVTVGKKLRRYFKFL